MKNIFIIVCVLVIGFCFIVAKTHKVHAGLNNSQQIAQEVGNQDPDSPDFAPGEKADGSAVDVTCDTQDPYSPCFAPGEKADDTAPPVYSTPSTSTPKSTTTITPVPQNSYLSEDDILKMTQDGDSDGVGLLGALFLSPIVSMIFYIVGLFIFFGVIILIIVLLVRRSNKKEVKSGEPAKSEKENEPKENK